MSVYLFARIDELTAENREVIAWMIATARKALGNVANQSTQESEVNT
jgi:hypothetical protein